MSFWPFWPNVNPIKSIVRIPIEEFQLSEYQFSEFQLSESQFSEFQLPECQLKNLNCPKISLRMTIVRISIEESQFSEFQLPECQSKNLNCPNLNCVRADLGGSIPFSSISMHTGASLL